MKTQNLYNMAEKDNIHIDRFNLPKVRSMSLNDGNKQYIAIDKKITSKAEERVCLAHELGHCEMLAFYNIYSPVDIRSKYEVKADRWAIKKLIPESKYRKALKSGYIDIYSLAEFFDVTNEFMCKAVEYYRK